ncbi:MAG: 7-carboxy-7-deazaguanine synthase QueE [Candidatus Heimdallarchaeota archaeon]|nr:7-carboxy-7-deazaguanine synthase QueE [Candidatus Heimdallarchaeota archaeon]MCK4954923.1 7-carboxy-7-deazaguanine synthase QueE [Candidatus Heimdallarchaeota archaeon]
MSQGYLQEIFSSFQGEGAAIEGSCYGLRQILLRFSGCPLALGIHGTKGCIWCDSPRAKLTEPNKCLIEKQPGNQSFSEIENPLNPDEIVQIIIKLTTKDLHSISLTGGEPLYQQEFLEDIIKKLKKEEYCIYLETAYTDDLKYLERVARMIDYACVDIKDRSAQASIKWENLVKEEIQMSRILKEADSKVFAKTVVTKTSRKKDIEFIAKLCSDIEIPLVIQLVSPIKGSNVEQPTWNQIQEFTQAAAKHLPSDKVGISIQMHKCINIL